MGDIRDPYEAERLAFTEPDALQSRREFLQRTAAGAGLAASLGLILDPDTVVAQAARRQHAVKLPAPKDLPIDTFVVLMMENRSFDHYLGWLPGADGRQAGLTFTDPHGAEHGTHRLVDFYQSCGFLDPDHSWDGGRIELAGGRMDGFLKSASDTFAIGYYTEHDLPFTPYNAKAFTAFDRFFCSLLGPTYVNREYMHAAQSYGEIDNVIPASPTHGELGFPDTTIFALLKSRGIDSRYYYTDLPISALWGVPGLKRSTQVQLFYEMAAAGKLPPVSFVDPGFLGEDQGVSGDEHPLADVRVGQAFMADVVQAFMESPQWKRGALFCVYDEWGGFFDHVRPPRVPDLRASSNLSVDFGQMGFRIPAVLVSPYARRGHVDHGIYGFESILKMIRYRFGLPPLTPRDLYANNIAYAFDFGSPPRLEPPDLPKPRTVIASRCPGTPLIDSGGSGIDDASLLGTPLARRDEREQTGVAALYTTGYLDRLGFDVIKATPARMFRHPSTLGFKP
jgi:phospholipase C